MVENFDAFYISLRKAIVWTGSIQYLADLSHCNLQWHIHGHIM